MKLLYCVECDDVVRLHRERRECECGTTAGRYVTDSRAEVEGQFVPFGIHNAEFVRAAIDRTDEWPGREFRSFIIPRDEGNLVRIDGGSET